MTRDEMLKIAYAQGVLLAAEDAGITKEAIVGKALGWIGKGIAKGVGKALGSPKATSKLMHFGKGGTKGALGGGLFTGGMSAMGAPEGERGKAFAQGFLPGALGFGPGWHLGGKAVRVGMRRGIRGLAGGGRQGAKAMGNLMQRSKTPWLTQRRVSNLWRGKGNQLPRSTQTPLLQQLYKSPGEGLKTLGSKAVTRGLPFGGAMLGASALETPATALVGGGEPAIQTPVAAAIYHSGRQAMGRGYGATPQAQYPSNYSQYY